MKKKKRQCNHTGLPNLHPFYRCWIEVHRRCRKPDRHDYPQYGGRGIKVCERWESFDNFYEDLWPTWKKGLTLGRIDNDGNYEPSNCRWETIFQQARNTRANRHLTFRGETKITAEWAEIVGIPGKNIGTRLWLGWTVERALTEPMVARPPRQKARLSA